MYFKRQILTCGIWTMMDDLIFHSSHLFVYLHLCQNVIAFSFSGTPTQIMFGLLLYPGTAVWHESNFCVDFSDCKPYLKDAASYSACMRHWLCIVGSIYRPMITLAYEDDIKFPISRLVNCHKSAFLFIFSKMSGAAFL